MQASCSLEVWVSCCTFTFLLIVCACCSFLLVWVVVVGDGSGHDERGNVSSVPGKFSARCCCLVALLFWSTTTGAFCVMAVALGSGRNIKVRTSFVALKGSSTRKFVGVKMRK